MKGYWNKLKTNTFNLLWILNGFHSNGCGYIVYNKSINKGYIWNTNKYGHFSDFYVQSNWVFYKATILLFLLQHYYLFFLPNLIIDSNTRTLTNFNFLKNNKCYQQWLCE